MEFGTDMKRKGATASQVSELRREYSGYRTSSGKNSKREVDVVQLVKKKE